MKSFPCCTSTALTSKSALWALAGLAPQTHGNYLHAHQICFAHSVSFIHSCAFGVLDRLSSLKERPGCEFLNTSSSLSWHCTQDGPQHPSKALWCRYLVELADKQQVPPVSGVVMMASASLTACMPNMKWWQAQQSSMHAMKVIWSVCLLAPPDLAMFDT